MPAFGRDLGDKLIKGLAISQREKVRYVVCWTEAGGLYSCGCNHETIEAAMICLVPDGRSFIRAVENGITRSLDDAELKEFLGALTVRFAALRSWQKEPGAAL
ncbi:MAG TPA: hypothetical protein VLN58_02920 [Verrucomicrobiae bacterium]|nr:hypothetical protein [Verrucomicrobiae bacterium]